MTINKYMYIKNIFCPANKNINTFVNIILKNKNISLLKFFNYRCGIKEKTVNI